MKILLSHVYNEEKTSKSRIVDGVEKGNKKYTACSIRCADIKNPLDPEKEAWINGFGNSQTKSWNVGDEVDVEIYDEEYNGQTYKKFKTLDKADVLTDKLNILHERLVKVEEHCFKAQPEASQVAPPTEAKPSKIAF